MMLPTIAAVNDAVADVTVATPVATRSVVLMLFPAVFFEFC
jgi:hypothetical protein